MRLMENKNPLVRLVVYGKIKKMMKEFKDKDIDPLEKNMMRGMFRRKLKDFVERMEENNEPLIQRLKFSKLIQEAEEDTKAKDEFRMKFMNQSSHKDITQMSGGPLPSTVLDSQTNILHIKNEQW